jgi:hypothetical protein
MRPEAELGGPPVLSTTLRLIASKRMKRTSEEIIHFSCDFYHIFRNLPVAGFCYLYTLKGATMKSVATQIAAMVGSAAVFALIAATLSSAQVRADTKVENGYTSPYCMTTLVISNETVFVPCQPARFWPD